MVLTHQRDRKRSGFFLSSRCKILFKNGFDLDAMKFFDGSISGTIGEIGQNVKRIYYCPNITASRNADVDYALTILACFAIVFTPQYQAQVL